MRFNAVKVLVVWLLCSLCTSIVFAADVDSFGSYLAKGVTPMFSLPQSALIGRKRSGGAGGQDAYSTLALGKDDISSVGTGHRKRQKTAFDILCADVSQSKACGSDEKSEDVLLETKMEGLSIQIPTDTEVEQTYRRACLQQLPPIIKAKKIAPSKKWD